MGLFLIALGALRGAKRYHFGALGAALGLHFGVLGWPWASILGVRGVPLGAFGAQAVPKTASPD